VLIAACFDGENILTSTLDLNDSGRGKFDFDVVGHYNRPDVFRLIVNQAPAPAVVTQRWGDLQTSDAAAQNGRQRMCSTAGP
jgi:nitrilase